MNTKEQLKAVHDFIDHNYRHFNSAVVKDASLAYANHMKKNGKMMITLAGAMSTAELGISLADMIRNDKVQIICSTGANLEEDVFNLIAHDHYERVPGYRYLSAKDEESLLEKKLNRVTDTCIPEEEAMRKTERKLIDLWKKADREGKRFFPYEFIYQLLENEIPVSDYQIDPKDSWVLAAKEKNIPIIVPGWEDSTTGNVLVAAAIRKEVSSTNVVKSGLEAMIFLIDWYKKNSKDASIGFFQIGGGIAGDFPICTVPLINQDLREDYPLWGYFCQISDSTTSYGSYSGAVPNEKITWGKIHKETPSFVIESDATIVAPLMFAYILAED
ncbi:MAG TPA: deoxyhypusine synthase family protein [Candidatus Moranbacteria bacterium]|nr:deoxyhypusine synthase family protein [Candidatus Moranbacteria bacterium]